MNGIEERYKGFHPYKMDSKYRVSVLTQWRPQPGESLFLQYSTREGMPLVKILTQDAYNEKIELIRNSDKPPAEKSRLRGKLALLCREASLNDQGKLLIPKDLSEQAGIAADSDVMLAGQGIHFEVWSKSNFDRYLAFITGPDPDDDLGIF